MNHDAHESQHSSKDGRKAAFLKPEAALCSSNVVCFEPHLPWLIVLVIRASARNRFCGDVPSDLPRPRREPAGLFGFQQSAKSRQPPRLAKVNIE